MTLKDLHKIASAASNTPRMPLLFAGHGSPMNAIEDNEFTQVWQKIGHELPVPRAIVCISAHWETRGTFVSARKQNETIHDFYGFPRELYEQKYPADGEPGVAQMIIDNMQEHMISNDYQWGLDHGAWVVFKHMYPHAGIPVIQISIDHYKDLQWHYSLAEELSFLRSKGIMVVGSGNIIHNLRLISFAGEDFNAEYGYDWAYEINNVFNTRIDDRDFRSLVDYKTLHKNIDLAIPTLEHYVPFIYILGMINEGEKIDLYNNKVIAGSLNMTSLVIQ